MSGKFSMDDYVDVAERIAMFTDKYPDGSLQSKLKPVFSHEGVLTGWLCVAKAYRTPDDKRPGVGHAMEPVPGKTPYTRDSEAMNAETSAWGRAIIALGFQTKKIASANEVRNRRTVVHDGKTYTYDVPVDVETFVEQAPDTTRLKAAIQDVNDAGQTLLPEAVNRAAIKDYKKPVAQLEQAQVDALADRLEKHAAGLRAAQGSGGDRNGTSPATVEPAAPDAPVAVNTTQSSTPGDAVVFSPPDTGSTGDTSGDGESGTEAAGSPADNTPFKAPTSPRGSKRKAAA